MRRLPAVAIVVAVLLGVAIVGVAAAQDQSQFVRGEPGLSVFAPEPVLEPGETNQLDLQIANDGTLRTGTEAQRQEVTTARAVRVEVDERGAPFTIETERQSIGSVPDSDVRTVPIAVRVPSDADPGTYRLNVYLRYSYVSMSDPSGVIQERTRRMTRTVEVEIRERPRFDLRTVESDVQVGGSGTVAIAVENHGEEPATDVTVSLEPTSANVGFGEAQRDTAPIDRLGAGNTTVVEYDLDVRPGTTVRNYSFDGTVAFTDPEGLRGVEDGLSVAMAPADEQEFDLEVTESTLRVGEAGTITGTVRNDGPAAVEDVAVGLGNATLEPRGGPYAVGELESGESTAFTLGVAVPEGIEAVPQRVQLATAYRTGDGRDVTAVDPVSVRIDEQEFDVEVTDSTLRVGETGVITGTVRNDGPVAVEAVTLTLGEGVFEPRSRTYAVGDLETGESAEFRFRALVPEGVDATPQRIDVATTYRTAADQERSVTEPVRVPIADRRDAVTVTAADPTFVAGEEGTLALEVTNERDVRLRDIRVQLAVEDPLESEFRTAVVPSLEPGATDRVAFDLEVDSDAPESRYPAVVDVEYLDPDDETQPVRPLTVAVTVTEDPDEAFLAIEVLVFLGVAILVVAALVWLYRR